MNFHRIILLSFISVLLSDALDYMSVAMGVGLAATYITGVLKYISFFSLAYLTIKTNWASQMPQKAAIFFKILVAWNIITIVRGLFTANSYWDWKYLMLFTSLALLMPLAVVVGMMFEYSKNLYSFIVTKLFLFGFIVIPLTGKIDPIRELYARGMVISVCFFILLSPYFKLKWRLLTFIVAIVSIYLSFDFRTNVIRSIVASLIFTSYYLRKFIPLSWLKLFCLVCFITPLLFLFLGITGQYNFFRPTDDIDKYEYAYDNGEEKNVAEDTRTFIYQEQFASMRHNNSMLLGEGGAGTYKTEFFDDISMKEGRPGSEVGFLNILLYSGIVGVVLYALMLFSAAYYAINYSNNFLCKMLGLFLAFRWIIFFIEDFTRFDMNYYFIWVAVGLCLSKGFRSMSDTDITQYFSFKLPAR